jgi:3,4-dihydroxy 2-butanone 4-phosphate synthase/GTP cyclohydrolase II
MTVAQFKTNNIGVSPIEDIIADMAKGRMVIMVDDEDRENEGDLVIAADAATPDAINFMAMHGRGLICLAINDEIANRLGLDPMARHNRDPYSTAFTVSIDAKEGISTGISAYDRARTIAVAIDDNAGTDEIVAPGHMFPLLAKSGGVIQRAGHTEAAVDLAVLGGRKRAGVICEIMRDDGEMARLPDLLDFASAHDLKIGTIADLIEYRKNNE